MNDAVNRIFAGARQKLIGGLKVFDESASATFTTVKITKDGLIVRGDIGSGPRLAPVVQFNEIDEGRAFSALATWIPGGKIDRYIWSWAGHGGKKPAKLFATSHRSSTETHRFIFPKPAGMDPLGSVSLRIEGTQTGADGVAVPIAAESAPQIRDAFGTIVESPAWWEQITTPLWLEDTKPGARLKDLIAGHITLQSDEPRGRQLAHNTLVYFPDWRADEPLEPVARAMAAMRRRKVSLVLTVVLPADALDSRRSDLEARLGAVSEPVRGAPDGHRGPGRRMVARLRGRQAAFGAHRGCAAPVRMEFPGCYRTRGNGGGARQAPSSRAGATSSCAAAQDCRLRLRLPRRPRHRLRG